MLKVAVACVALAFATQASAQSIIERAKQREAQQKQQQQQQQQQQQKKDAAGQAGAGASNTLYTSKRCNRSADGKKLSGEARKRYVDQCMQGKP